MAIVAMLQELRGNIQNPDAWFVRAFGGRETSSGVQLDADSALSSTALWQGVRLLSESLASVPLNLHRKEGRASVVASDHPVHRLLRDPNPELTSLEFREMSQANLTLTGDCYAEIVWNSSGEPVEMWPIWPHRIEPLRLTPGGPLLYRVSAPSGEIRYLRAHQVFHVRGFSRGGLVGENVVDKMREALGLGLALERFGASFFGSGSTPGGILEYPGELSPEASKRLRDSWEEAHRGVGKANRVAILEEGMTWKPVGVAPEQAQAIETRKFQVTEVARILNLPPNFVGDLERATFSNIEHQGIHLVVYSLRPWYERWEQRYNKSLLLPNERGEYYTKHRIEGLLRGDLQSRFAAYTAGRQWGWMSANDVMELEDRNPIEEPWADEYLIPLNMIPASQAAVPAPAPPPADPGTPARQEQRATEWRTAAQARAVALRKRTEAAYRRVFAQRLAELFRREINAVRAGIKKQTTADTVTNWLRQFYGEAHAAFVATQMRPSFEAMAQMIHTLASQEVGSTPDPEAERELEEFVQSFAAAFGASEAASSRRQLEGLVRDAPDLEAGLADIEERLDEWEETRADKASVNASVDLGSAVAILGFMAAGVTLKRWFANANACPLCREMDGRVASITGPFARKGDTITGDGDTSPLIVERDFAHPQLHKGCDCSVVASF